MWENAFFQTGQKDHGEFQTLGAVQGHEGDCIGLFFNFVQVTDESYFLKKSR